MKSGDEPDHLRQTKIGNILRKLSIDELPEIFNILKGEMSIVGPRPLPTHYLDHYDEQEIKRHDVLPGLTGLAQINGRNAISWKNKFSYDLEYVKKNNIWIDFKIILKTFLALTRISTVNASEDITMMPLTERLHIVGAGGHAKVIIELAKDLKREIKGVYDKDSTKFGTKILGIPIEDQSKLKNCNLRVLAVGNNYIRKSITHSDHRYATLIHPKATISKTAQIANGSVIFANAIIQSMSEVGKHVIINTGTQIDHDCVIEDYCHIAPGTTICGDVRVGESTFVCAGCTVIPQVSIEKENIIAAGATVNNDIKLTKTLWAGIPAKKKKDL